MNKPFSLVYEEFKQKLADLINNCGLPVSVIETVLQNYLSGVSNIARNQYQSDKIQYEQSLLDEEKNKKEKSK